jgi:hypothetical protein
LEHGVSMATLIGRCNIGFPNSAPYADLIAMSTAYVCVFAGRLLGRSAVLH